MYAKGNPGRSSRSAVFRPTLKSVTRFFLVASVPPRNLFAVSSRHDLVDTSPERGEGKRLIKRSRNHESRFDYIGGERGGASFPPNPSFFSPSIDRPERCNRFFYYSLPREGIVSSSGNCLLELKRSSRETGPSKFFHFAEETRSTSFETSTSLDF